MRRRRPTTLPAAPGEFGERPVRVPVRPPPGRLREVPLFERLAIRSKPCSAKSLCSTCVRSAANPAQMPANIEAATIPADGQRDQSHRPLAGPDHDHQARQHEDRYDSEASRTPTLPDFGSPCHSRVEPQRRIGIGGSGFRAHGASRWACRGSTRLFHSTRRFSPRANYCPGRDCKIGFKADHSCSLIWTAGGFSRRSARRSTAAALASTPMVSSPSV